MTRSAQRKRTRRLTVVERYARGDQWPLRLRSLAFVVCATWALSHVMPPLAVSHVMPLAVVLVLLPFMCTMYTWTAWEAPGLCRWWNAPRRVVRAPGCDSRVPQPLRARWCPNLLPRLRVSRPRAARGPGRRRASTRRATRAGPDGELPAPRWRRDIQTTRARETGERSRQNATTIMVRHDPGPRRWPAVELLAPERATARSAARNGTGGMNPPEPGTCWPLLVVGQADAPGPRKRSIDAAGRHVKHNPTTYSGKGGAYGCLCCADAR